MMAKRIMIFIALVLLVNTELLSQKYFFKRYSIEEGLSQSKVYCIIQDSRGYIWMGTDGGGLSRFDGVNFETFTKTDGLSDNVVRSMFEDSKKNIWIGTGNGLTLYNGFEFVAIGKEEGLNGSTVLKIIEGSDGIIWAGTNDGGLSGLTIGDSIVITNYTNEDGLISSNFVFDIYEDAEKKLWLGMVGGVNIIEFGDDPLSEIETIFTPEFESGSIVSVISIEPGHEGSVWLGTYGDGLFSAIQSSDRKSYVIKPSVINREIPGLFIWDILNRKDGELWIATDKNGVIRLRDNKITGMFNREKGLPSNQILDIMVDNEGNCWFASFGQGAIMFGDERFISYNQSEGLTGNQVLGLLFDTDDIFYVTTEEGFLRFRNENGRIRRLSYFTSGNGLNDKGANAIIKKDKQIWIGTNNGINILDDSGISEFSMNSELPDRKINCLLADSKDNVWIGTNGGYGKFSDNNLFILSQEEGLIHNEVQTIIEDSKGRIWMGTIGGLVRLEGDTYTDFNTEDGLSFLRINCLAEDPAGNIWVGTFGGGIFKFNNNNETAPISVIATKGILSSNTINSLLFLNDTILIAGNDKGFDLLGLDKDQLITNAIHFGLNDGFTGENNINSVTKDKDGLVWFGTKNGLVKFNPALDDKDLDKPGAFITDLKLFFEEVDWIQKGFSLVKWSSLPENLVLSHNDNHVTFELTGFSYHNPEDLVFSYSLEPQSKEWSPYSSQREIQFPGLTPGSYIFKVKAKNKYGMVGETTAYTFSIKPPFWQTTWFVFSLIVILIVGIIVFIRLRERQLIHEKQKLEKIVEERTKEVVEQKDEIAKQRDVVTYQKKEITDSILYAETIQLAVLPEEKILKKHFNDHFILFRPKDIVSGDFYWMSMKNDHLVFTAADCTGHGVPGAFMSMLGVSFLNKIVNEAGVTQPSEILNSLRENIIAALKQKGSFETSKDGMDIALCSIDIKKNKLWFAGANNPLFIIRKTDSEYELIEKRGDMMPVGFHSRMNKFTNHEFDIEKGDSIYLFSDGFIDQFGGADERKFMKKRFRQMLLDHQELDMPSQRDAFIKTLEDWMHYPSENKTPVEQIDDIIILGIRI